MRLRDLISITENKTNKQINLSIRKKQLDKAGLSVKKLLDTKLHKKIDFKG